MDGCAGEDGEVSRRSGLPNTFDIGFGIRNAHALVARDGQGTDMVSTAILMTAGADQAKVPSASADLSPDQGELEGISFAKSFNERVAGSTFLQEKDTEDEAVVASPSLKSATFAKRSDEVAIPALVQGKAIAAQKLFAHSELKSSASNKIGQPQTQEKITAVGSGAKKGELPAQMKEAADDVSHDPSTPSPMPAAGLRGEGVTHLVSIADGDRPSILGGGVVAQKETKASERTEETSFARKTAKTQENATAPKTVPKIIGTTANAIAVDTPAIENSAAVALPVVGQMVTPTVAVQGEVSKPPEAIKVVSGATKPLTGVFPAAMDGPVRKETAFDGKTSVLDTATGVTAAGDPSVSPKSSTGETKVTASMMPIGSDGENKGQGALDPIAAVSHSLTGGSAISSSAPRAIVSGNTPQELSATKLPAGDLGGNSAGLPMGLKGQDGPGIDAPTLDGSPRLLTTTPTALEVGIQSGTHGWLKVRAEMSDVGLVNASVSSSSSAGQEMLRRELPALTAYLQEEKVLVNGVVVQVPSAASGEARSSAAGMESPGGENPSRNNEGGEQQQYASQTTSDGTVEAMTYQSLHGVDEDGSLPLAANAVGGSWLSVRA
jgi:hypothetical protein